MKRSTILGTSIVVGFFLMVPLAMLFNKMDWPLFHSWALAHGSFLLAWPMLTLLSYTTIKAGLSGSKDKKTF